MAASRFSQRGLLRRIMCLGCLVVALKLMQRASNAAFTAGMPMVANDRQVRTATAVREAPVETRQKQRHNSTERNFTTLELNSGFPDFNVPGTAQNPPWAKCVVEAEDRSMRDEEGTVMPRKILEEWVMKGTKEHIGTFQGWRNMKSDSPNMRCHETTLGDIQGVDCLECVKPRMGGLPSPSSPHLNAVQGSSAGIFETNFVMTFDLHELPHCLTGSGNNMGFCKSGSVSFAI